MITVHHADAIWSLPDRYGKGPSWTFTMCWPK
jgi:hypothetical protein